MCAGRGDYLAGRAKPTLGDLDNQAFLDEILDSTHGEARALLRVLATMPAHRLCARDWKAMREKLWRMRAKGGDGGGTKADEVAHRWMLRALQCKEPASKIRAEIGEVRDLDLLLKCIRAGGIRARNK